MTFQSRWANVDLANIHKGFLKNHNFFADWLRSLFYCYSYSLSEN